MSLIAGETGRHVTDRSNIVQGATAQAGLVDTTETTVLAAPGVGARNYVTSLTVSNEHATVGTQVEIRDASGGAVIFRTWAPPANAGVSKDGLLLRGADNGAITAKCVTTGSKVHVSASGYKAGN